MASASGTLLWHPALTSCYDILLRQAEGLRMERPPRQYNLGAGHFGASLFLLRLECAPFNSPLHLSKHSCSSFNSASFSPKVSPRSRCPPHVLFRLFCIILLISIHFHYFIFNFGSFLPKTHKCISCRSRQELSNEYLLAKIGVDTAENEPLKVWRKIQFIIHSPP